MFQENNLVGYYSIFFQDDALEKLRWHPQNHYSGCRLKEQVYVTHFIIVIFTSRNAKTKFGFDSLNMEFQSYVMDLVKKMGLLFFGQFWTKLVHCVSTGGCVFEESPSPTFKTRAHHMKGLQ